MRLTKNILAIACFTSTCLLYSGCTLKEKLNSTLTEDQAKQFANVSSLLQAAYLDLTAYEPQDGVFSLEENSSDECLVPTRGGDWDDNGVWRVIHSHNWNADHSQVSAVFNSLLKAVFDATNVLTFSPSAQQAAEAKYIRDLALYTVLDLYGQFPYREPGENLLNPPKVLKGVDGANFIITELEGILSALPAGTTANATQANQNAARVLLMKLYLNKGTYGANRGTPTFDNGDMQKVITYAGQITGYTLSNNYFDNFVPNNDAVSTENIFTIRSTQDIGNSVKSRWFMTLHYSQPPGGWNGFSTVSDVYNKFGAGDKRVSDSLPGSSTTHGVKVGFLRGQQYDEKGNKYLDRNKNPLVFLDSVHLVETNPNTLEATGIRIIKYPIQYNAAGADVSNADNDYVIFRYADVLLMKAEALLRQSAPDAATALTLVNQVRTKRGATALASITLPGLLDERQREFYWEGWRRQDMVRFGTFLAPRQLKPTTSDPKYLWFPVPNTALAVNPNLSQNPGY